MVGPNEHGEFPFRDAFNRLDAIASRGTAGARLAHLLERQENLRGQGKSLSPDECLNLGLALYDAGRASLDEAVFWVCCFALGVNNRAKQRIQTTYGEDFASRFEALAKRHGLNEEQWTSGDGSPGGCPPQRHDRRHPASQPKVLPPLPHVGLLLHRFHPNDEGSLGGSAHGVKPPSMRACTGSRPW